MRRIPKSGSRLLFAFIAAVALALVLAACAFRRERCAHGRRTLVPTSHPPPAFRFNLHPSPTPSATPTPLPKMKGNPPDEVFKRTRDYLMRVSGKPTSLRATRGRSCSASQSLSRSLRPKALCPTVRWVTACSKSRRPESRRFTTTRFAQTRQAIGPTLLPRASMDGFSKSSRTWINGPGVTSSGLRLTHRALIQTPSAISFIWSGSIRTSEPPSRWPTCGT